MNCEHSHGPLPTMTCALRATHRVMPLKTHGRFLCGTAALGYVRAGYEVTRLSDGAVLRIDSTNRAYVSRGQRARARGLVAALERNLIDVERDE